MDRPDFPYITLYTDEDIPHKLAVLLRQRGCRVASAYDVGLLARPDEQHLNYAAARGMTMLVFNGCSYMLLARRWRGVGRHHAGILITDQFVCCDLGDLVRRVSLFMHHTIAPQMINRVRYLQEFKVVSPLEFAPPTGSPKSPSRR